MKKVKSFIKLMVISSVVISALQGQNTMAGSGKVVLIDDELNDYYEEYEKYYGEGIIPISYCMNSDNTVMQISFNKQLILASNRVGEYNDLGSEYIRYKIDDGKYKNAWKDVELKSISGNTIEIMFEKPLIGNKLDIRISSGVLLKEQAWSYSNYVLIENIDLTNAQEEDESSTVLPTIAQLPKIDIDGKQVNTSDMNGKTITAEEHGILSLTTNNPYEDIYYTTDGSEPTINSKMYRQPMYITKPCTVKLVSMIRGGGNTEVVTIDYDITPPNLNYVPQQYKVDEEKYNEENSVLEVENKLNNIQSQEDKNNLKEELQKFMCYTTLDYSRGMDITYTEGFNELVQDSELICNTPNFASLLDINSEDMSNKIEITKVQNPSFTDVPDSHWAANSIKEAAELGLVKGMPDGTFKPSANLTYADTSVFLDRVYLLRDVNNAHLNRDEVETYINNKEHWAFEHMASIASRLNMGTLDRVSSLGDKPITRGMLAQIIYESLKNRIWLDEELKEYADVQDSEYKYGLEFCIKGGILTGIDDTHMVPQKEVTRAELMTILIRLMNNISTEEGTNYKSEYIIK